MSSNFPPPSGGQNPYAQQQYGPPAAAPAPSPYAAGPVPGQPGHPAPAWAPPAPVAARRDNVALGILAGVAVMLVAIFAYAGIMRAMAKDDGHYSEVGYIAIVVGLLVGAAIGKVGGRNPALPVAGLVLAVLGVFFGEIVGLAMIASHYASLSGQSISWFSVLTQHFGDVFRQWKHDFDVKTFLFLALAGLEGFVVTRRVAG